MPSNLIHINYERGWYFESLNCTSHSVTTIIKSTRVRTLYFKFIMTVNVQFKLKFIENINLRTVKKTYSQRYSEQDLYVAF